MRRSLVVLLLLAPSAATAKDKSALSQWFSDEEILLLSRFTEQEDILISGTLPDDGNRAEFGRDAHGPASQPVLDKWRGRAALYSRRYLDSAHTVNTAGRTVAEMSEPGEWSMLRTSVALLSDHIAARYLAKVYLDWIERADEDLKDGSAARALKVVADGRRRVRETMTKYLSSPAGQAALAQAQRAAIAPAPAAISPAPLETSPSPAATARTGRRPSAAATGSPPAPARKDPPPPVSTARRQAERANEALLAPDVSQADALAQRAFDGGSPDAPPTPVPAPDSGSVPPALAQLQPPVERPALAGPQVPSPSASSDLDAPRARAQKSSGRKKWLATGAGAALGALIGLLLGGPIGAAIGAAAGAFAGRKAAKLL